MTLLRAIDLLQQKRGCRSPRERRCAFSGTPAQRLSNGNAKGWNNTRNGNRYLGWAFVEAGATGWQTTAFESTWTRSGTDGFPGLRPGAALTGGLDPDGCLVRISPQPPLRTTEAHWKGGTTTTSGYGGLVLR